MKKFTSLALSLFLLTQSLTPVSARQNSPQETLVRLTNKEVMEMVRAGLGADTIIAKIKRSRCNFDTFPGVLAEMKRNGVPETVILAMIEAPYGLPNPTRRTSSASSSEQSAQAPPGETTEINIPVGTNIEIETVHSVNSQDVQEGSTISFIVLTPVKVNGVTVIARNARATARVTTASGGRRWGRGGKLAWTMQDVIAVDGSRVPLAVDQGGARTGNGRVGTVATGMIVTSLVFLPAVPLWALKKGKPAVLPAGQRYSVIVRNDTVVKVAVESNQ